MSTALFTRTSAEQGSRRAPLRQGRHAVPVVENRMLAPDVYRLTFRDARIARSSSPAQFVNLYSKDPMSLLPRPFGVCEVHGDEVSLLFAVVGKGTREFSLLRAGDAIDVLGPLGNPFDLSDSAHYVLVGGGLGVPPLIYAAERLYGREDAVTTSAFGYRDVRFARDAVSPYVHHTYDITDARGNVVDLLDSIEPHLDPDRNRGLPVGILSCGPMPMMRAVAAWASPRGLACQFSLEARMACGYGTCVVCVVDTASGRKKVCSEGPVFTAQQLGWE